jgi:hypothetical protein
MRAASRFVLPALLGWLLLAGCNSGTMPLQLDDDDDDASAGDDDTSGNQPPGAPVIAISPEDPTGADDLTCEIVTPAVDPDGDEVAYAYSWIVNDSPTNQASSTVSGDYTSEADAWSCTVVPSDGLAEGPSASASVTVGHNVFELVQELSGAAAADPCPDCEFTFDITYTTLSQTGSCSATCGFLYPDGVHTFGYSSVQGMVMVYFSYYDYSGWYGWYYATFDGARVDFYWNGHGYTQGGYWDVDGETMTGLAINSEP